MAMKQEPRYHPTESLILAHPRTHYRTSVRPGHWQLRSLIAADNENTVYFPSNQEVIRLDVNNRQSKSIKIIPFSPRCLVSLNGWICCGGENGEFCAFRIDEATIRADLVQLWLDPDTRLPPDLENLLAESRNNTSLSRVAELKTIGRDRINCISLWYPLTAMPPSQTFGEPYLSPLAVLANNDKSVTIVDLEAQEKLDEIMYPDCVNRALLSPDGMLLVAVSDDPFLYVHQRTRTVLDVDFSRGSRNWRLCRRLPLLSQSRDDRSVNRGSFAACFSSTGKYLAVGTQYGTISIFSVDDITRVRADPLLTSFSSSRPNTGVGAVRDMAFCPGPYDLLAWTEDRGRVGIADVRSNFISRQIIEFDKWEDFDHMDVTPQARDENISNQDRASYLAELAARRLHSTEVPSRSERERNTTSDNSQGAHASRELTRTQSQRRRTVEDRVRTFIRLAHMEAQLRPEEDDPFVDQGSHNASSSSTTTDTPSTRRSTQQENTTARSQRRTEAPFTARIMERASRRRGNADTTSRSGNEQQRGQPSTTTPAPSQTRSSDASRTADSDGFWYRRVPWTEVTNYHWLDPNILLPESSARDDGPTTGSGGGTTSRTERAQTLIRQRGETSIRRSIGAYLMRDNLSRDPPDHYDTAGLSWSKSGRILFIACENGIYKLSVDLQARKFFPCLVMR